MVEMPMCVDEPSRGLAELAGDVLTDLIHARSIPGGDNRTSWRANRRHGISGSGESEMLRRISFTRAAFLGRWLGRHRQVPPRKSAVVIAIILRNASQQCQRERWICTSTSSGMNEVTMSRSVSDENGSHASSSSLSSSASRFKDQEITADLFRCQSSIMRRSPDLRFARTLRL